PLGGHTADRWRYPVRGVGAPRSQSPKHQSKKDRLAYIAIMSRSCAENGGNRERGSLLNRRGIGAGRAAAVVHDTGQSEAAKQRNDATSCACLWAAGRTSCAPSRLIGQRNISAFVSHGARPPRL